ncbi:MAG: TerB family tellurite resistance protein [Gammaproteobacteria bacterium]|nr:MAG: TerB family tellurite resistance protein [Gammaproteobacteria bacterium]
MIATIQAFLSRHLGEAGHAVQGDDAGALQLAMATLLMEVARADHQISVPERRVIEQVIEKQFALSPEAVDEIAEVAEHESEQVTSLYPMTRLINDECSAADKAQLIKMLWKVTCADGKIDPHEEHLVRKIADLLHVPHREFIRAKLQVSGEAPVTD